jgi:ABC-2 type transport system permease protein
MGKIAALAFKDLRLLVRDKAGFFFTFFFPLIIAVLFGTIFGGGDHTSAIPIILIDEDGSPASRAFVDTLTAAPELRVRAAGRQEALESVRRGKVVAYVAIKPGFGQASGRIFWGAPPAVELGADPARQADAGMIEGLLMKYASKRFQQAFTDVGAQRRNLEAARADLARADGVRSETRRSLERFFGALDQLYAGLPDSSAATGGANAEMGSFQPISIDKVDVAVMRIGPTSAYAITFPQGIIWGFIGVTAAFGISIVTERVRGTLLRLQVASITRWQILAGKALACFIAATSVSAGLLALAYFAFGVHPGSWPLLALAVISSALSFVGLMMLLSVLGKTEEATSGIGWAVLLIFSMVGGGMIPYFFMPSWMSKVSHFSPVKWSVMAMEGAIWRHYSLAEMLLPCGILVGTGIIFFAIGVRAFTWASAK